MSDASPPRRFIVERLMNDLIQRYGRVRGEQVYWAMLGEGRGPFSATGKYRHLHEGFVSDQGLPEPAPSPPPRRIPRRRA